MEVPLNSITSLIMAFAALVTAIGSLQVVLYRIKQLEVKMEKHNNFMARLATVEADMNGCYRKTDTLEKEVEAIKKGEYK